MNDNIAALIEQLGDENDQVRQAAITTLQEIGIPAGDALIEALRDSNAQRRANAALLLGVIGDRRAIDPLISALNDTDFWVWHWAAFSLGRFGDIRALEPLLSALKNGKSFGVAEALGVLGDERAIE